MSMRNAHTLTVNLKSLDSQLKQTTSAGPRQKLKSQVQAAKRKASLWWPRARQLRLRGLRVCTESGDEDVVCHPNEVQAELIRHWAPI